jgi:hypothetical protein
VFLSAIAGVFFGCVYRSSERILIAIRKIICLLPNVISALGCFSYKNISQKIKEHNIVKLTVIGKNLYEAALFLLFGIGLVILNYVTLDGVFRIYVLIIVSAFFFISKKSIGDLFSKIFDRIFGVFYFISFWVMAVLVFPLYKLIKLFVASAKKTIAPVQRKCIILRSKKLILRKKNEVYVSLSKL